MQAQVEETNKSFLSARDENAKLYNEVQDLKGAIRVYCRVRPLLASDESDTTCVTVYAKTKEVAVEVPKVAPPPPPTRRREQWRQRWAESRSLRVE
jgi:hypothetical protein